MAVQPKSTRILVVDDDSMSRELLHALLEHEGYSVECAESGDAALQLLREKSAPPPEIVLTDVQMPGTSGGELARLLRSACPKGTMLLAMSGSGPPEDELAYFDGFLLKPFAIHEVGLALAEWKEQASANAILPPPELPQDSLNASKFSMGISLGQSAEVPGQAAEKVPAVPVLDEEIYTKLAGSMPLKPLHQMYAMCLDDARARISTMRRLLRETDAAQFVREAHSIKGGAGMLGATELYRKSAEIEKAGLAETAKKQAHGVNPLDELSAACDRLERILASRALANNS